MRVGFAKRREKKFSGWPIKQVRERWTGGGRWRRSHALCHLPSPFILYWSLWTEWLEPEVDKNQYLEFSYSGTPFERKGRSLSPAGTALPLQHPEDSWLWEKQRVALGWVLSWWTTSSVVAGGILPWFRGQWMLIRWRRDMGKKTPDKFASGWFEIRPSLWENERQPVETPGWEEGSGLKLLLISPHFYPQTGKDIHAKKINF